MIRQLISAREYTKPVQFFASVDARKRLKPASTEDGYKPFCSVDRPLVHPHEDILSKQVNSTSK